MNSIFKVFAVILFSLSITGCADNVKRYKVDAHLKQHVQSYKIKPTSLVSVTMPKGDNSSVMCRLNSQITLPDKMSYSQYISDALTKSLECLSEENCQVKHKLKVVITEVSIDTLSAKWCINAEVTVDDNKPIVLKTVSEHSFSFIAPTACSNAASAFDEAVDHFIKELLTDPEISKQLSK